MVVDNDESNDSLSVKCQTSRTINKTRRIKSELALEEELPWHFEPGVAYHCFSFGDVDALTYLRCILKQQPIEYLLLSTWCMSMTDVSEISGWIERGIIGRADFYDGEIFQASYADIYLALKDLCKGLGGRVAIFSNHSKVMAGFGKNFDFAIESSANVNTNPRSECAVVTIDSTLARFYKEEIFDNIKSFNNDFPNWEPYNLKRNGAV